MTSEHPIKARLKFLANLDEPLVYIPSKGGGDNTDHVGNFVMQEVDVLDARRERPSSDLDVEGFRLVTQATAVGVTTLLVNATGASRVEIFDDTRRTSSLALQKTRGIREPAGDV
jgi:hypothetical protein